MKKVYFLFGFLCSLVVCSGQQPGVAINTNGSLPHSSAMLDVQSTTKGILIPRMTTTQRTVLVPVKGLLVFDNTTSTFWFYNGTAWTELVAGGADTKWNTNGTHISNSNTGNVGIGTSQPTQKLEVNGNILSKGRIDADGVIEGDGISSTGSFYVQGSSLLQGALTGSSTASFGGNINSNTGLSIHHTAAILQLKSAGVDKGFLQLSGDDLRLGTNAGNTNGQVYIRTNGANRFQFSPSGRLSILADQSPTLYFNTGGTNKAYLQLQGDHIKLDAPGNKVLLGDDMTVDDATNRVGIGTSTPEQKLHVTGNAKLTGGQVLNNNNENMLPIGYATYNGDGIKLHGTTNLEGGWVGNVFNLLCNNVNISNSVVIVTCRNARLIPSWVPNNDHINIRFYDDDGDEVRPTAFSVVIYKTN